MPTTPSVGQVRSDGYRFRCLGGKGGHEVWLSPTAWRRERVRMAHLNARKRAEKLGVPFSVTVDDLVQLFPADARCPVLGSPMVFGGGIEGRDSSPSIDRLTPALGYVPGNLVWISNRANTLKRDATLPEVEALAVYMKAHLQ